MSTHSSNGTAVPRRDLKRQVGESNRDCIARLAGQLRATEQDRDAAAHDRDEWRHAWQVVADALRDAGRVWRTSHGRLIVQHRDEDAEPTDDDLQGAVELVAAEGRCGVTVPGIGDSTLVCAVAYGHASSWHRDDSGAEWTDAVSHLPARGPQ